MERPVLAVATRLMALAALIVIPASAEAQVMPLIDDPAWGGARLRVTPFAGWATGVTREEGWRFQYQDGSFERYDAEVELGSGPMAGLTVEYGVRGAFSILAGAAYLKRDDAVFTILNQSDPAFFTGSHNLFARAGVSMRLDEETSDLTMRRLGAAVYAAPFFQLEMPEDVDGLPDAGDLFDNASHFGLNLGVTGELPFASDRMALTFGFEDYFTWWSKNALARLPGYLGDDPDAEVRLVDTTVSADMSHQWVIRAGISFRF